jgi:hypothetical protein
MHAETIEVAEDVRIELPIVVVQLAAESICHDVGSPEDVRWPPPDTVHVQEVPMAAEYLHHGM